MAAQQETKAAGSGGYVYNGEPCRFVEVDGMLLAASRGGEAVVANKLNDGGVVHELPGESFVDEDGQRVVHFLDVQGEREAFVLLVVVQQADSLIVSVKKL